MQLANALPFDLEELELAEYRNLNPKWHDWNTVKTVCAHLATMIFARVSEVRKTTVVSKSFFIEPFFFQRIASIPRSGTKGLSVRLNIECKKAPLLWKAQQLHFMQIPALLAVNSRVFSFDARAVAAMLNLITVGA